MHWLSTLSKRYRIESLFALRSKRKAKQCDTPIFYTSTPSYRFVITTVQIYSCLYLLVL
ncbi:hypothetical protein HMPREF1574_01068 [Gardnerella pickettii JCP7659]|nr:hypothetical protein HMPREF1574_01068 [Gardnerella pickettii JCP7659]